MQSDNQSVTHEKSKLIAEGRNSRLLRSILCAVDGCLSALEEHGAICPRDDKVQERMIDRDVDAWELNGTSG